MQTLITQQPRISTRNVSAQAKKGAVKNQRLKLVEVPKPLGIKLGKAEGSGGGVKVVSASGNAAKAGMKSGDTIVYVSSYFGDELWPADSNLFVQTCLNRAPSPVAMEFVQGPNETYNVKRLGNKAGLPKVNRKLTAKQQELATHICIDCGYIYCDKIPFAERDNSYVCPQCQAPKRRFSKYNVETGRAEAGFGEVAGTIGQVATVIGGLVGLAVLANLGSKL